jgi:hypothetical protein
MKKSPLAVAIYWFFAIFLIAFSMLSLWFGGAAAWADASSLRTRWLVSQLRQGTGPTYSAEMWLQTRNELQAALRVAPGNAQLMDDLGYLNAARAMGLGTHALGTVEQMLQQKLLTEAIVNYRAATLARPGFAYSWAYLALAKHLKGEMDSELWSAFDKAVRYGHNEAGVQPAIAQVAFGHWSELSPERKNQLTAMLAAARPVPRQALLALAAAAGVTLAE